MPNRTAAAIAFAAVRASLVLALTIGPSATLVAAPGGDPGVPATVTVMTRNLYFGADLLPAIAAPNLQALVDATTAIFASVQATRFQDRAEAIADEIAATTPDLVGLQEVALWRSGYPATFPPDTTPSATTVEYDFLALLQAALDRRGVHYEAAAVLLGSDVQSLADAPGRHCALPVGLFTGACRYIRFTDREAILARTLPGGPQLHVSNAQTGHFAANLDIVFVGGEFHARRGWASVDVQLRGRNFRFVSTHLEPDAPPIQALQAAEIVAGPAATDLPVVFVCDCNSPADGSGTPTYANLIASGFTDAWSQRFPSEPGYTCCIEGTLTDPTPTFDERLDLVLFRGPFATTDIAIVGNDPADRTPSGLWPSDHAGVVGALRQSNGR